MEIEVLRAEEGHQPVLRHLLQLYKYDFTAFDPEDVNEDGLFDYEYFDRYWTEANRHPFLIRAAGRWAGFALVRKLGADEAGAGAYWMAEFFVMRKYRLSGVGRHAAFALFRMFPGTWRVGQIETNDPARTFWRRVIGEFTVGRYEEIREAGWDGPIQQFVAPVATDEANGK